MTIFRERDRRAEDRKRRSRGGGRGETKVEIRPPSVGRRGGGGGFHDDAGWSKDGGKMEGKGRGGGEGFGEGVKTANP